MYLLPVKDILTYSRLHETDKRFALRDESPRLIRIYIDFLKTGHLHHPDSDETTDRRFSFGTLIDIFGLAKDFEVDTLRNAALDEFFLRILDNPDRLPYKYIADIYKTTSSGSSLRSLIVDVLVNIGMKREVQDSKDDLPKGFMMDCLSAASEDGIVPFPEDCSDDDVSDWLYGMKEKLCDLYHVHDLESEPEPPRGRPMNTRNSPRGGGARSRQEDETSGEESNDGGGIDPERQRLFDAESAERMRYLMEPLPPRQRY